MGLLLLKSYKLFKQGYLVGVPNELWDRFMD